MTGRIRSQLRKQWPFNALSNSSETLDVRDQKKSERGRCHLHIYIYVFLWLNILCDTLLSSRKKKRFITPTRNDRDTLRRSDWEIYSSDFCNGTHVVDVRLLSSESLATRTCTNSFWRKYSSEEIKIDKLVIPLMKRTVLLFLRSWDTKLT